MQFNDVAVTNVKKAKNGDTTLSFKIKYEDWEPEGYDALYALWYADQPVTLDVKVETVDGATITDGVDSTPPIALNFDM